MEDSTVVGVGAVDLLNGIFPINARKRRTFLILKFQLDFNFKLNQMYERAIDFFGAVHFMCPTGISHRWQTDAESVSSQNAMIKTQTASLLPRPPEV
jgi:hypothetical protein